MPPADVPDFDSMSPEEVMAWMESLAKRQGAKEGFLTDADMEIAEVDPSSVLIDEPGYVPFGEETRKPASQERPPAEFARTEPVQDFEPEPLPVIEDTDEEDEDTVIEEGSMAWLESLAADQADSFPEMDLSALTAELSELPDEPEPEPTNPIDWLESLTEAQPESEIELQEPEQPLTAEASAPAEAEVDLASITDPLAAGIDPMLWLESLAKRQGAKAEEFTTSADMEIPTPEGVEDSGPEYQFSIEDEPKESRRVRETVDPAAWLESMSMGDTDEGTTDDGMTDDEIQEALASGAEIPPDQMERFFARQLERGLSVEEVESDLDEFDPDAPPVPAELPDWLLEQVQPPDADSVPEPTAEDRQPALVDEIMEPPGIQDLPDWLQVDETSEPDLELESIFEGTEAGPDEEMEFFSSDPWVQAFSEEAASDPDEIPEWYERNLRDPERIAAVEKQMGIVDELAQTELPAETRLPEGEPEAVPDWIDAATTVEPEAEAAAELPDWLSEDEATTGEIPDWLAAADVEVAPEEIPDWLRETIETEEAEEAEMVASQTAAPPETPAETTTAPPSAPPAVVPAPAPIPAPAGDIAAALESARSKAGSGDLDNSLREYESVIRANAALDQVIDDLSRLAERHQDNPAVYRVLGDSLMRQGKLQAALDTYRKALNQL